MCDDSERGAWGGRSRDGRRILGGGGSGLGNRNTQLPQHRLHGIGDARRSRVPGSAPKNSRRRPARMRLIFARPRSSSAAALGVNVAGISQFPRGDTPLILCQQRQQRGGRCARNCAREHLEPTPNHPPLANKAKRNPVEPLKIPRGSVAIFGLQNRCSAD